MQKNQQSSVHLTRLQHFKTKVLSQGVCTHIVGMSGQIQVDFLRVLWVLADKQMHGIDKFPTFGGFDLICDQ